MKTKIKTVEQFKNDCLKVIKYYRQDLDIDIAEIKKGAPNIFFAYESGSHAISLRKFEDYPAIGVRVPYLFGSANREHMLNEVGTTLDTETVRNSKLVHHFDGHRIKQITLNEAKEIVRRYKTRMRTEFISVKKMAA